MPARASRMILVVAAIVLAAGGSTAHAEDAAKARELFTQGNTFFDVGQFDKAIHAWQQGYQLKNDPGFLYNIAQAYRTQGDASKAIFFYKRYLANAPHAHNRADVEQKIAALQKQVSGPEPSAELPPPESVGPVNAPAPPPPEAPAAPAVSDTAPRPASAPLPAAAPSPSQGAAAPPLVAATAVTVNAAPTRRVDLRVAAGFDAWTSGLQETAQPSFAFTLGGGYTFGAPTSRFRFRLGALFGYTFLKERGGRDTFTSFVVDPTLVFRATARLTLMADLGLGAMSISGLTIGSALLANSTVDTKSTQGLSLARVGFAAEYDLRRSVSVFVWPALANSAKKQGFYQDIGRFELLAGVAYRL